MITLSHDRSHFQPFCGLQESEPVPREAMRSIPAIVPRRALAYGDGMISDSVEVGPETWLSELWSCISQWFSRGAQFVPSQGSSTVPLSLNSHRSALSLATDLIKQFEGLSLSAYQDSGKVWTIGYGSTQGVSPGNQITFEEAELLLSDEVERVSDGVINLVKVPLTSHEHAALISFAYNVGLGNLQRSTLLHLLNEGHKAEAANELHKWVYCNEKKLPGLVRRREAEYRLFLGQ